MSKVEKFTQFGERRWITSIRIPIEVSQDKGYIKNISEQLLERCIKEYIQNAGDCYEMRRHVYKNTREVELTIELEDLLNLREYNRSLHKQLVEMVDEVRIYKEKLNEQ